MIPVTQTMFYDPTQPVEKQRGNCLQAVIASLLELPLDEVPHFVQDDVDSGGQINWWNSMVEFVRGHGWGVHGAELDTHPGEHLMVAGPSPRGKGIHHVVIYKDGQMVHDPHPDRTGLLSIDACWGLHRLEAAAEHNPLAAAIAADPSSAEHGLGTCVSVEDANRVLAEARGSAAAIARAAWSEGYEACYRGEQRYRNPYRAALASPAPAAQGEGAEECRCGHPQHRQPCDAEVGWQRPDGDVDLALCGCVALAPQGEERPCALCGATDHREWAH